MRPSDPLACWRYRIIERELRSCCRSWRGHVHLDNCVTTPDSKETESTLIVSPSAPSGSVTPLPPTPTGYYS